MKVELLHLVGRRSGLSGTLAELIGAGEGSRARRIAYDGSALRRNSSLSWPPLRSCTRLNPLLGLDLGEDAS